MMITLFIVFILINTVVAIKQMKIGKEFLNDVINQHARKDAETRDMIDKLMQRVNAAERQNGVRALLEHTR